MTSSRCLGHLLLVVALVVPCWAAGNHPAPAAASGPDPLRRLVEGNARFVAGRTMHPNQARERRAALVAGQKPFAIVLTCADSRVAPEIYFDQGLGDIFVLRNAGNIINEHMLGSIEYAVEHLGAGLIVVVGHTKCGAVAATVAGGEVPGHIGSIVKAIQPAAGAAYGAADAVGAAVRANARYVAELIRSSQPILAPEVHESRVQVVAAVYDLATGKVELLDAPAGPVATAAQH